MFILTDGKKYVMENPCKTGMYISTTSPVMAKNFTYKQAKNLLQNKKKSLSWVTSFYMVNQETGEEINKLPIGNGGAYIGENDIGFNERIINEIFDEADAILDLSGYSLEQLREYGESLRIGLSKYDSAESDIGHALQKYKEDNNGKKPQAHKMAKIGYLLDEIRDKRKHIKVCMNCIRIMEEAITNNHNIIWMKQHLEKAKQSEYNGRTEYYQKTLDLLNE